jgi:hypothetical protein
MNVVSKKVKTRALIICLLPVLLDGNVFVSTFLNKYENSRQNSEFNTERKSSSEFNTERKSLNERTTWTMQLRGGQPDGNSTSRNNRGREVSKAELKEILAMLLLPNSTLIRETETSLNACAMRPRFVECMVDILLDCRTPVNVRQLAGTVMRRKLELVWDSIDVKEQTAVQLRISDAILSEPVPLLRRQLALLFGATAKLSSTFDQLDAMVRRVNATCSAEDPACRELGIELMLSLVEDLVDEMRSHHDALVGICESALSDHAVHCCTRARARTYSHERCAIQTPHHDAWGATPSARARTLVCSFVLVCARARHNTTARAGHAGQRREAGESAPPHASSCLAPRARARAPGGLESLPAGKINFTPSPAPPLLLPPKP